MAGGCYLDWNATTPLRAVARAAWLDAQDRLWANPASVHRSGQAARLAWDEAMVRLAARLGCRPHELVATAGGTEAIATAIAGALADGGRAVVGAVEHSSVLRNCEARADAVDRVAVDACGRIDPEALGLALQPDTRVVCLQYANNELGTIQDLPRLVPVVRERSPRAVVVVDACQGVGKERVRIADWGADAVAAAGHKFGAPVGTGLLFWRTGLALPPLLYGGRQQEDRRSGSEDLPGLLALAAALEEAWESAPDECERQRRLLAGCFERIRVALPAVRWLAREAPRLAGTMSLAHPGVDGEALVARLDLAGFGLSRASACMARSGEPSHVVAALGLDPDLARSVVRVSIGWDTRDDVLQRFAETYVREVRAMGSTV